jgi:SAM-dependent methyltransferase
MHPGEHEIMARVEERHWWFRGLRDLLARMLARPELALPPRPRILDAGCGTGENLRLMGRLVEPSYLGGFDASEEALAWARRKAPAGTDLYRGDICAPEIHAEPLDLVLSLDVIYVPGVARARPGLERLVAALAPGGLLVLDLPAYRWLYSEHDVAMHTSERYTAREVGRLLASLGLVPVRLGYRLCLLFPAVVLARIPSMWRARPGDPAARSDLHAVPPPTLNEMLYGVLRLENRLIAHGLALPWGSSVWAVGRKP